MNILYLHSHDTGRAVEPHGYDVETPNLMKLAREGAFFRNAHCAAPTCSPSRAALLTGEFAHQAGMVALAHRGGKLKNPERHLAGFLAGHGYESVLAGISHVGPKEPCGYTRQLESDHRKGDAIVQEAVRFLKESGKDKPFFLDVGFIETHRTEWVVHGFNQEHHSPTDGDGNPDHRLPPAPLPDVAETRRDWLDYVHSVERLDRYYGDILNALEEAGLADDTIVLATTDHGIAFPMNKCSLTAHGTGVFQILKAPGKIPAGRVTDALVSHLDVYPTFCELLGLDQPDWLQGTSLLPLLNGEKEALHENIFAEVTFHAAFEPKRSVRSSRYNYIRNFAAPHTPVKPNCDRGYSKDYLMRAGLWDVNVSKEELYDLDLDPLERHNLADDPHYAEALGTMRAALQAWMKRTEDPILESVAEDCLPLPQTVNTWDQPHPGKDSVEWDPTQWREIDHEV